MTWLSKFQLFLFDFDGLLVNTEELHLEAYRKMCRDRGFALDWDLKRFFESAHVDATSIRRDICATFPELLVQEPNWEVLYAEKKAAYQQLLEEGELKLMPGVEKLLEELRDYEIRRCVVTNATKMQIDHVRKKIPLLDSIPVWITRECYKEPKPNPECYQKALEMLKQPGDKTVGFEDSMRGLKAMMGAGVDQPILICPPDHPQMAELSSDILYFSSIADFNQK